jgi:hypothetical protein
MATPSHPRQDPRMPCEPPIYRRQALYDQVWTEPLRDVARISAHLGRHPNRSLGASSLEVKFARSMGCW